MADDEDEEIEDEVEEDEMGEIEDEDIWFSYLQENSEEGSTSNDSALGVSSDPANSLWEKRCQVLKDDEKQLWGDIKPTMMSEEESDDQNAQNLQRRRPSWRSDRLNDLIDDWMNE
ncbi:hypothetical protein EMCRGX_G003556 [Ephydatia muelleri]